MAADRADGAGEESEDDSMPHSSVGQLVLVASLGTGELARTTSRSPVRLLEDESVAAGGYLSGWAKTTLVEWMRPSTYLVVDGIPRLASGKLDRVAMQVGRIVAR